MTEKRYNLGEQRGIEKDLVRLFVEAKSCGHHEDRIPMSAADTIVLEMAFRAGRADIVVFHADGSASVIEAKDGSKGYTHVVSGIGQASLYAVQLAVLKGLVVRRCVMWTSTGDLSQDALIESACELAGVVALPWASMKTHMDASRAVRALMEAGV